MTSIEHKCTKCNDVWQFGERTFDSLYGNSTDEYVCMKCQFFPKRSKWYEIKKFSYHVLLYFPIPFFIGLYYGFFPEMLWIVGGIYMLCVPEMRDFLMKIF